MALTSDQRHRLSIRPATPDDAEIIHRSILDLARHVGELHKVESTSADLARHMLGRRPARFEGLIAEIAGEFAGMCLYFPSFSTWLGRPGVYVQDSLGRTALPRRQGRRGAAAACRRADPRQWRHLSCALPSMSEISARSASIRGWGSSHSDAEQIHAALRRRLHGAGRRRQPTRSGGIDESLLRGRAETPRPQGLPVERRAAAQPGKAGAGRTAAGRRARGGLRDRAAAGTTGWGRSLPSTRRNISISWSIFLRAGSASRARRPK